MEKENRPLTSLLGDLVDDIKALIRQEMRLAKTEISEKVGQAGSGAASLAVGGAVLFAGFLVLLYCAVLALSNSMAPWVAALIVGVVVAVVGIVLLMKGRSNLKASNLAPERTMASLQRDRQLAKEQVGR